MSSPPQQQSAAVFKYSRMYCHRAISVPYRPVESAVLLLVILTVIVVIITSAGAVLVPSSPVPQARDKEKWTGP